ncbi:unnamed protein product [Gongylonema pulchrum]|uniref:Lipoprotein n=1 Tax=Gongylonema pulchrum TaxID=637853 RepID=A0A183E5N3_9BILA|nr:unnamed protein product [Gongylonema pulchrum]
MTGCAAARILSNGQSNLTPPSATSLRQKFMQNAVFSEHNPAAASASSSSVFGNGDTAQPDSGYSGSTDSGSVIMQSESIQNQTVLLSQCSSSAFVRQTSNYPASIYLSDGENTHFDKVGCSFHFFIRFATWKQTHYRAYTWDGEA